MKIGVRAHDYGKMEIKALAELLKAEGYDAAQLVLHKAFTGIDTYEDITLHHLERIRTAFEKHHIDIPVFGCYMDISSPKDEVRTYAVNNLKRCLAYSKEVGAKVVGTESSYGWFTLKEEKQALYPYMLDSILRVVEEAERLDVKLALEPVRGHILDSLETTLDTLRKVNNKKHLRLIFDAANVLDQPQTTDQSALWKQWLSEAGQYIEAMHIKDCILTEDNRIAPTTLGNGFMDYTEISKWLHSNKPDMYLIREELKPATAQQDIQFLRQL